MANSEKITELIDEKAFEQWQQFVESLDKATSDMAKAAEQASKINKEMSKTNSAADFEKKATAAAKANEDLARKRAAAAIAEERLTQAQIRTAEMIERRLKKEQALNDKRIKDLRALKAAEEQFAKNATDAADDVYDANKKIAQSERDLAEGRAAAEAAAMSNAANYQESIKQTTKAISDQKKAIEDSDDVLALYSGSFQELVNDGLRLKSQLKDVQTEIKSLNDYQSVTADGAAEVEQRRKKLAQTEIELQSALRANNLELRRAASEQNAAAGSSDQLSARLDRLRAAWRALSEEERENGEIAAELEDEIQRLDKQLKQLDERVGVHTRKVGNYEIAGRQLSNALTEQFPILDRLKREYEGYSNILSSSVSVLKNFANGNVQAAASTTKASAALRIFRIALISTGIGAIVVILGSLIAYLTTTAEGIDRVTAVTRPLQAIMRALLGVLQNIGGAMVDAFVNPRKALRDLSDFIERSLLPHLRAMWDVLAGVATLDFGRAREGLEKVGADVNNVIQSTIKWGAEAWKTGQMIDEITKNIQDGEIDLIKTQGELNRTIQEQGEIARNTAKSESERRAAADAAMTALNSLTSQQLALQEKRIELLKLENKDTQETRSYLKELAELEAERDNIAANAAKQRIGLNEALNSANRMAESAAQKAERERIRQANILQDLTERQFDLTIQMIEADEQRATHIADISKRVAADERNSYSDRINNLNDYLTARDNAISLAYQREALEIEKMTAEATKLEEIGRTEEADALRKIIESKTQQLGEDENAIRAQLRLEGGEMLLSILNNQLTAEQRMRQNAIQTEAQERETALAEQYAKGALSANQYQLARLKLSEDINRKLIEDDIASVEKMIEANKALGVGVAAEEEKLAELKMKLSRQAADAQISDAERVAEKEREMTELRKEFAQELGSLVQTLFNRRFEMQEQQIERDLNSLTERTEREKEAAEDSALTEEQRQERIVGIEQRAEAERQKINERQKKLKRQQAIADKTFAALQVVGNTAIGITRAFADLGPIAGIPFAAIIGALGAVQLAAVLAQPLPQFFRGTKSSPEGLARVGEKGTELAIFPDGTKALTPNKETVTWLPRGTEILTNEQTKRYLAKQALDNVGGIQAATVDITPLVKQQSITNAELKRMQKSSGKGTVMTKSGLLNINRTGNKWSNWLRRNGI